MAQAVQVDRHWHEWSRWNRRLNSSTTQPTPPLPFQQVLIALLLLLLLSILSGVLAYQAPPTGRIAIGWLGDQFFLQSSAGLGADALARGDWYTDDLTPDSPTGRSRWTRQHATLTMPHLGAGTALEIVLTIQGWPADVVAFPETGIQQSIDASWQPTITVMIDQQVVGVILPSTSWTDYHLVVAAEQRTQADLHLDLWTSATFTDTLRGADPRPKGVRLAGVHVADASESLELTTMVPPAWGALGSLLIVVILLWILLIRITGSVVSTFALAMLLVGLLSTGLALVRIWMGAILTGMVWVLVVALIIAWHAAWIRLLGVLVRSYNQGRALGYGLIAASLVWLGYEVSRLAAGLHLPGLDLARITFPDSLLIGMLVVGIVALILVLGREGLPKLSNGFVEFIGRPGIALLLTALLGGIWLEYEALVISNLAYVGHADYADNAVVARNLVAGRGWVVDYVTQFYRLYDGVTRPQETWPLLQPVWIAPFLWLFGDYAWAAKLPNIIFTGILLLLIYATGARIWDRRVGMVAALLCITNHLFFKLVIYTTSDLAFVVFSFGAVFLLALAFESTPERRSDVLEERRMSGKQSTGMLLIGRVPVVVGHWATFLHQHALLLCLPLSGVLTGFMMLQKPSGAMIAVGMGVWLIMISQTTERDRATLRMDPMSRWAVLVSRIPLVVHRLVLIGVVWALPAILVLSPYLVRNMILFGTPVYSTERHDAWVLGFRGDSAEAWNDIYRVYAPELGGPGVSDRSWILRWGFDLTIEKKLTQIRATRDYLMPAWSGMPLTLFSQDEQKNLMSPLGAWLSFLGIIGALWGRRRLLGLLAMAFGPYVIFLILYWHANEERYFLVMMPWLSLLIAWMIWAGFHKLAALGDGRWSPLALFLVGVACVTIIRFSWPLIAEKVQDEPSKWAPDLAAYAWIREHIPDDAIIMTRNPWQLNWHAQRAALMIPNTNDPDLFATIVSHYGVSYVIFENIQRIKGDAAQLLSPLADARDAQVGDVINGFLVVYASPTPDNRVLIYRFPETFPDHAIPE